MSYVVYNWKVANEANSSQPITIMHELLYVLGVQVEVAGLVVEP